MGLRRLAERASPLYIIVESSLLLLLMNGRFTNPSFLFSVVVDPQLACDGGQWPDWDASPVPGKHHHAAVDRPVLELSERHHSRHHRKHELAAVRLCVCLLAHGSPLFAVHGASAVCGLGSVWQITERTIGHTVVELFAMTNRSVEGIETCCCTEWLVQSVVMIMFICVPCGVQSIGTLEQLQAHWQSACNHGKPHSTPHPIHKQLQLDRRQSHQLWHNVVACVRYPLHWIQCMCLCLCCCLGASDVPCCVGPLEAACIFHSQPDSCSSCCHGCACCLGRSYVYLAQNSLSGSLPPLLGSLPNLRCVTMHALLLRFTVFHLSRRLCAAARCMSQTTS